MTSKQWWYEVVSNTYKNTEGLSQVEADEWDTVLPIAFNTLYNEVYGAKQGWLVKEDAVYTLNKLAQWRDQGAGPKIGIVSNYDSRLPEILKGEILHLLITG
jgi:hypothetical protein